MNQKSPRCRRCKASLMESGEPRLCAACALELALTIPPPNADADATAEADAEAPTDSQSAISSVEPPAGGAKFGGYVLLKMIAVGGMGTVWEAWQSSLNRRVAVKTLRSGRFATALEIHRFHIEAGAAARLNHPNIVPIYEIGEHDGQQYFCMKLVEGTDLARELARGPADPRRVAVILAKVSRSVSHAHRHGVLHRDLKPANILLDHDDEPHLTDFGVAKASWMDSAFTHTADLIGTPNYMSPEQAAGKAKVVSIAADVWSLGAILYEALTGKAPFRAGTWVETVQNVLHKEPVQPRALKSGLDADLEIICLKCLEKSPSSRYGTAADLANDLELWLAGMPIQARRITAARRSLKWARRHPWTVAALTSIAASLILGATVSTIQWRRAAHSNEQLLHSEGRLKIALRVATSRRLAAQAHVELDSSPSLALLLAVESVETARRGNLMIEPAAFNAVVAILQEVGGALADPRALGSSPLDLSSKLRAESAVSPDSRWLAVAAGDGAVRLFEGRPPYSREARCALVSGGSHTRTIAWAPDSRALFTMGSAGDIRRWDFAERLNSNSFPAGQAIDVASVLVAREIEGAHCGAFIPNADGQIVGAVSATFEGSIRLRPLGATVDSAKPEWVALEVELPETNLRGRVSTLTASPDGRWLAIRLNATDKEILAVARLDGTPGASSPQKARWLDVGGDFVRDLTFSPDGRWLAIGRGDGSGYLFDLRSEDPAASAVQFTTHHREVRDVAFSSDSEWLVSVGFDSDVRVHSVEKVRAGEPAVTFRHDRDRSFGVTFSPDGRWICAFRSDGIVNAWEMHGFGNPKEPLRLRGPEFAEGELVFSPDGRTLWAIGRFGVAWRWEFDGTAASAWPRSSPRLGGEVRSVAYSPDGRWLGAAVDDGRIQFATSDLKRTLTLPGHDRATAVAFSVDDRWLSSIGYDGQVQVWNVAMLAAQLREGAGADLQPTYALPTGNTRTLFARKLAWHPRGWLYATSGDGLLFDWDFTAPDPVATVRSHRLHSIDYMLNAVAVSPDGRWLAVGRHGWDDRPVAGSTQSGNLVLLFDATERSPKFVTQMKCNHLALGALTFSPDSRWLACGAEGKPVLVWDLAAKDPGASAREAPFAGVTVEAISFSPDGRTLALGGTDGRMHFWPFLEPSHGGRSLRLPQGVRSTAFSRDGRHLATGGIDHRIQLWNLDIDSLIESARRTAGRDFTENERERFDLLTPSFDKATAD